MGAAQNRLRDLRNSICIFPLSSVCAKKNLGQGTVRAEPGVDCREFEVTACMCVYGKDGPADVESRGLI